jgi:hypothetical protein
VKYLSPLLLFGLNGVVILNGCRRYTERRVFLRAAAGRNADAARWLDAAMMLSSAMLAEFVHPHKQQK